MEVGVARKSLRTQIHPFLIITRIYTTTKETHQSLFGATKEKQEEKEIYFTPYSLTINYASNY